MRADEPFCRMVLAELHLLLEAYGMDGVSFFGNWGGGFSGIDY